MSKLMSKRVRRQGWRPSFETVEPRTLLSGAGVNLDFNTSFGGDKLWADVSNLMQAWNSPDRSKYWFNDASIPTSPQGYALRDASGNIFLDNYPDGIYDLSFKGTVNVDFWGIGKLAGPLVKGADGVTRGQILVSDSNEHIGGARQLVMTVTSIDVNDPMSDLQIWSPGYSAEKGQMYTDEFLRSLQPFDYIRFLNWSFANNTTVSDWTDLRPAGAFPRTNPTKSKMPYEDMIELANAAGKDIWLNVPALANDQFIANLASLVHEKLAPNLKVYIEYSNETWNTGFSQYSQVLTRAKADPLVTATGDMQKVAQKTALELKRVSDVFRQEFGAAFDRVIPVFAGWAISPNFLQTGLDRIQQLYGDPKQFIKTTAIAPYIAMPKATDTANQSLAGIFAALNSGLDKEIPYIKQSVQVAAAYGLPLDTYEAGQHLSTAVNVANKAAALVDPRMYDLYQRYYTAWKDAGGRQMTFFTLNGDFWGLKPLVVSPGGQRWDAVMSQILQPGDANLDGTVNFADFQVLAANYAKPSGWWESGDFNHDGIVDKTDLKALISHLDVGSLTASQAAEVVTFAFPAGVTVDQSVEFQLFARKYASEFPFKSVSNSGGAVVRNGAFNGTAAGAGKISINGVVYENGFGVSSASKIGLSLDAGFTTFSSIIGVDDRAGLNIGQATFQVIGDGRVLYTSPVMRSGDKAIPIEVDVRGVTTLSLVVTSPAGSNQSIPVDWAQARLTDSRSAGGVPFQLKWTVTKDGGLITSTSAESFVFVPSDVGDYVITVQATDRNGVMASRNVALQLRDTDKQAKASFTSSDTITQGTWKGIYGGDGYTVVNNAAVKPVYATVTVAGNSTTTWGGASSTKDVRGLQKAYASDRLAATWFGEKFTIDVNITDGQSHKVSLYALDWDSTVRSERIDVIDVATGKVLDTRTISSFQGGVYLSWNVQGHVQFKVTRLAGTNAVISGLFFDDVKTTPFIGSDSKTQGTWKGVYGGEGYTVVNDSSVKPDYASVSVVGNSTTTWSGGGSTKDVRALQKANASDRLAATWYGEQFTINVDITDGQTHKVSLYLLDWNTSDRSERIDLIDADTGKILDTRTISSLHDGVYLSWNIQGRVQFKVTRLSGTNAVVSGLFFDAAKTTDTPKPTDPKPTDPKPTDPAGTTPFVGSDSTTQGTWQGSYGGDGYTIVKNVAVKPAYATVTVAGNSTTTWGGASSTKDVRGLQKVDASDRLAATWFGDQFTIDVNITDGQTHKVSLYLLDWDTTDRSERIDVIDVATGKVLDTRTISSFQGGVYLSWNVQGRVQFKVTKLSGLNAVVSGVFFDAAKPTDAVKPVEAPKPTDPTSSTPVFIGSDTTTQGTWKGTYGGSGYTVVKNGDAKPEYASMSVVGNATTAWGGAYSTKDVRGLQKVDASDRIGGTWYGNQFTIDVNITDGQTHKVSLYLVDWDTTDRAERIDVIDVATGKVLDTRTISSFQGGVYLSWNVQGRVQFKVTKLSGLNAVVSGVFFD